MAVEAARLAAQVAMEETEGMVATEVKGETVATNLRS